MSNLLIDHLHLERVNVFILGRHEHACYTNYVEVADLPDLGLVLEIAVHQTHSEEECLIIALEVGQYLYLPVDHACSQGWRDLVSDQTIVCGELLLQLLGIVQYRLPILSVDIDILSLNFCGGTPQMGRWMSHSKVIINLVGAYQIASIQDGVGLIVISQTGDIFQCCCIPPLDE